jgi:hypothetical protein
VIAMPFADRMVAGNDFDGLKRLGFRLIACRGYEGTSELATPRHPAKNRRVA